MPGRILKFEELTSSEIAGLDRGKSALFLPVSPIEGHGPHLPLGVDYFDALHFAERAAEITVRNSPEFDALLYPGLPIGTQLYKLPGSIRIKSSSLYDVIYYKGESFVHWGFKYIFVLSGHGSPKDIVAIESACLKISKKFNIDMHNLSGALAVRFLRGDFIERISQGLPGALSNDDRDLLKKDIHGGWWETSMMLLLKPHLVKEEFKSLPDNEKKGDNPGHGAGYFGSPSRADAEFARVSLDVLIDEVGSVIKRCLGGENIMEYTVSPFYKYKSLRPKFKRNVFIWSLVGIKSLVICWLIYKYFIR